MLINISRSLIDLLGEDYGHALTQVAQFLHGIDIQRANDLANMKVEFYSNEAQNTQNRLVKQVGHAVTAAFTNDNTGAATLAYENASNLNAAPIGGSGAFRIGEDGKVYLAAKSEHYQASLGHHFGGYKLIDFARELGVINATHNNTRGYVTRLTERELIRCVNNLEKENQNGLMEVIRSKAPKLLNRVINLETGSLAVEAGIKMMLARFYKIDKRVPAPKYSGKIPVFFVMSDNNGGREANYHGTTILAQIMRDMWPELLQSAEEIGIFKVVGVHINDCDDLKVKLVQYNSGAYKTAGFLHEIILMNYGGIRLTEKYLHEAYTLCEQYDTPVLVDEIQSCMWYQGMFLFKLYGLNPDFVVIGKGFPGGEYASSKIITTYEMDVLSQFGALVTNGQQELSSLAYLVTMEFTQANNEEIQKHGDYFDRILSELKDRFSDFIVKIEGRGHLASIHFHSVRTAETFSAQMNKQCIDISAQTYKANCPPAALLKLPLITTTETMDYLGEIMQEILTGMRERS